MSNTLCIGVVGCGYWGPNLIRTFHSLLGCKVTAMCDLSEERLIHLKGVYRDVQGFTNYTTMLEEARLDAVVVAAPVKFHHAIAKASLVAGKHTLIEKPMASTSAECEELIALASKSQLVLMVGHTYLYSSAVRKITELVRSGELGAVRYINARRLNLGLFQQDINVAWDLAPHDLSIILHVLGEGPSHVNCQGHANVTPGIEDVTNMSLRFPSNSFATIQSSWLEPRKVREMTIVGTQKMIIYDDLHVQESVRVYDTRIDRPAHYDTFGEFPYSYHYGGSYIPYIHHEEPLKIECQQFADCIREGHSPLTGGVEGLALVKILEAASSSLRKNGASVSITRSSGVSGSDSIQKLAPCPA